MKKIGQIEISFKEYLNGVYYYDIEVMVNDIKTTIVLPRYHTFLGWIEVFGLPPQNEWVVLSDLADFEKTGVMKINNKEIIETVLYSKRDKTHTIKTTRQSGDEKETCIWKQDFSGAPESILSEMEFDHKGGKYKIESKTEILASMESLSTKEAAFASGVIQKNGQQDVLIKKSFNAVGEIPEIYYSLFPIQDFLNLTNTSGTIIELGYLRTESPHKVDKVHGDWYKRFYFGDKQFFIQESNYSSCTIETEQGPEQIKNTYKKELFVST